MPDLDKDDRKNMVRRLLKDYYKTMSKSDVVALIAKTGSRTPLYLATCCEELRLQVRGGSPNCMNPFPRTVTPFLAYAGGVRPYG